MKLRKIATPVKLWRRFLAFFIDYMVINLIIVFPFGSFFKNLETYSFKDINKQVILITLIIMVLTLLYWSLLEYLLKQSVGKAILNIFIRSKDKELKFWQCLVRNISKISLIILFIDSFNILFRGDYERYFEKISKTEVVDGEI